MEDMENLACEICFEDYDDSKVVPKVLDCGHSMCGRCIHNVTGKNLCCPKCLGPIVKDKKYKTNYSILSLIQQKEAISMNEENIGEEFSQIIEKLKKCQCLLSQKVEPQQKLLQLVDNCLKLKESKKEETDVYTLVSASLSDLSENEKTSKRNLEIVTQCLALMEEVNDNCKASGFRTSNLPIKKAAERKFDLSLRNFADNSSYLRKIREKLQDQEVYVAHPYEGKILYGKLGAEGTYLPKMLKLSALEAKEVPPEGACIIKLHDLKDAAADFSFCAFLYIINEKTHMTVPSAVNGGIIIIDVKPNNCSASQFIKLCTGECGLSYKHCYFRKEEIRISKHCDLGEQETLSDVDVRRRATYHNTIHYPTLNEVWGGATYQNTIHYPTLNNVWRGATYQNTDDRGFVFVVQRPNAEEPKGVNDFQLFGSATNDIVAANETVIQSRGNGAFAIYQTKSKSNLNSVLGIVRNNFDLSSMGSSITNVSDTNAWKIEDCGGYFY